MAFLFTARTMYGEVMTMELGDRIKKLRNEKNISQEQLAEMADISLSSIRKYEANMRNPRPDQLNRIAEVFEISPYALKEIDVKSDSDLFAILVQLNRNGKFVFEAEKDSDGSCIPETVSISFENSGINSHLALYMDMLEKKEEFKRNSDDLSKAELSRKLEEIDNNIEEAILSFSSEEKSAKKSKQLAEAVCKTKPKNYRKLEGIIVDCSPREVDYIIQSAKFIKKISKEIQESQ